MYKKAIFTILTVLCAAGNLYAAVGCTLNDPDRDIKRLFPKATNYKTEPTYESIDVSYAYYTVLNKRETIGYVHGVNQKGMYGGIQLILATEPNGVIMDFYYQKITSPESKKFRDEKFTEQFIDLSLADFYTRDLKKKIKDPSKDSTKDYLFTLRGIKKNLILQDEFKLKNKYDKYFYTDKKKDKNIKENKNEDKKRNK